MSIFHYTCKNLPHKIIMKKLTKARLKELRSNGVYYGQIITAPRKSIGALLENLLPDEKIIKITSCNLEDKRGALAITTLRVVAIYSSSFSLEEISKDFKLSNITSISTQAKMTNSIIIHAGNDKIEAKLLEKHALKDVGQALRNPSSFSSYNPDELFPEEPHTKPSRGSTGKKVLIGFVGFFLFLFIIVGLSDKEPIENTPSTTEASVSPYSYTVINDNEVQGMKKSLDIRLEKEITKEELAGLANEIKSKVNEQYQNIFISYYLPSMEVGEGAWATTHFTPDLQVKIIDFLYYKEEESGK